MSQNESNGPDPAGAIDLAEVARLVAALENDLARVKSGSAGVEALRVEVEQLREALGSQSTVTPERLHAVRGLLGGATGELEVDAIKAAGYLTQIGRLMGLG